MFSKRIFGIYNTGPINHVSSHAIFHALVLALIVFAAALFGIYTRPVGFLASFWPVNALLLGLLVRRPDLATPIGWLAAACAYVAADLVTGGELLPTLLLSSANLVAVAVGYVLFSRLEEEDKHLRGSLSVIYLALIAAMAAAAAGLVGAVANPILFDASPLDGWILWFVTELANFIIILPVVLTCPKSIFSLLAWRRRKNFTGIRFLLAGPAIALVLSCAMGIVIGGPGALAFPVPALLWCGLSYSPFASAVLTLLFSVWTLLAISILYVPTVIGGDSVDTLLSIRIAVALIALAPLTVSSVMEARNALLLRLQEMANHDSLTGLLNRRAFTDLSSTCLARCAARQLPVAVMMLDIDHFKCVNDTYGHACGDLVLKTFAGAASGCLRENDIFGRTGGEEFCILLPGCQRQETALIAERIRVAIATIAIDLEDGRNIAITTSIGTVSQTVEISLEKLLLAADTALYRAKEAGRNQIKSAD